MKIGILTYSKANNFGAMMQALALKHTPWKNGTRPMCIL